MTVTATSVHSTLISISIISHDQGDLFFELLPDLIRVSKETPIEVLLTKNMPETLAFNFDDIPFPIIVIENSIPKGFGANHNAAFKQATGEWFCVMNPDIRLSHNPFPALIKTAQMLNTAVIAPAVLSPEGDLEDSVRYFPTPISLLKKLLSGHQGSYHYTTQHSPFAVDWVGGMFMLFRATEYASINGFDEKFFLYYEDVDICARLRKSSRTIVVCPSVQIIHFARRTSRRNLRYMHWHLRSMTRYFRKHLCRIPTLQQPNM